MLTELLIHSKAYSKWHKLVKERRDHVVHRGLQVTPEQAKDAHKAMFDLLIRVDNSAMEHFQIQMGNIGLDGPHMTFGTVTFGKSKVWQISLQYPQNLYLPWLGYAL